MSNRLRRFLAVLLATPVLAGLAVLLLLDRIDLGGFVAGRASAALGRELRIAHLHLTPGRWIGVTLEGARLDNIPGGTAPAMAELGRLEAEVELLSLLRGPVVVRRLVVDGLSILLERTAEHQPNWRFGPAGPPGPEDRRWFPTLLDSRITRSELTFRTTGGKALRSRIEAGHWHADGAEAPVRLEAEASYNGTPLTLAASLGPIAELRDAGRPYATALHFTLGTTRLDFTGSMARPLDADGAIGRLALHAPDPAAILAIAGTTADWDAALDLAGHFERHGDLWQLRDATGSLDGIPLTAALLELREGSQGRPDAITADLGLERAALNKLLGAERPGRGGEADIPLMLDPAPDPLISARLAIGTLEYAKLRATEVRLAVALLPGRIALEELALTTSGAEVRAAGMAVAQGDGPQGGDGARIGVEVRMVDADLDALRRDLGLRELPLSGRLTGAMVVAAEGRSLNAAARGARVSAVVAMREGRIAREVVEMASLDLRLLFREARGTTPVRCLLGVLDMRAGVGTLAPLRIRAATGTIGGMGSFDLNRRQVDLVVGSLASTTDSFALDIPVRVSGSFADPGIRPAQWSAAGRAALAARDAIAPLPPSLREFATANPCFPAGGR